MTIIDWLEQKRSIRHLEFRLLEPLSHWISGYHDVVASFEYRGRRYDGRGQATSRALAMVKAAAEAVEHLVGVLDATDLVTSNGLAIHRNFGFAARAARNELIERDIFLCHVMTGIPFEDRSSSRKILTPTGVGFQKRLKAVGIDLRFGVSMFSPRQYVVIAGAFGADAPHSFGVAAGLSSNPNLEIAIRKSMLEAWMVLFPILNELPFQKMTLREFLGKRTIGLEHHQMLGLDVRSGASARALFSDWQDQRPCKVPKAFGTFHFRTFEAWPRDLGGCPLVAVRCTNPQLQQLYAGVASLKNINVTRLREFLKERNLREPRDLVRKARRHPHFFG